MSISPWIKKPIKFVVRSPVHGYDNEKNHYMPALGKMFEVTKGQAFGAIGSIFTLYHNGVITSIIFWLRTFSYDTIDAFKNKYYIGNWKYIETGKEVIIK